jgi:hypothetical protein
MVVVVVLLLLLLLLVLFEGCPCCESEWAHANVRQGAARRGDGVRADGRAECDHGR